MRSHSRAVPISMSRVAAIQWAQVVTEGTVRLESRGATRPAALLPAGSIALVRHDDVLVRSVPLEDAEHLLDWRQGLLAFRDTTLSEAAAEFNRYNARKLVIGDAEAGALRIGGSFQAFSANSRCLGFITTMSAGRRWAKVPTSRAVPQAEGCPVREKGPLPGSEILPTSRCTN